MILLIFNFFIAEKIHSQNLSMENFDQYLTLIQNDVQMKVETMKNHLEKYGEQFIENLKLIRKEVQKYVLQIICFVLAVVSFFAFSYLTFMSFFLSISFYLYINMGLFLMKTQYLIKRKNFYLFCYYCKFHSYLRPHTTSTLTFLFI